MNHFSNKISEYAAKYFALFWKKAVRFSEKHCWIVVPLVALVTYFLFWYILADVRLPLWRQMLKDYLLIIAGPLYLSIFSGTMNDIYEYSQYESRQLLENSVFIKDVHLSIWEETRYYKFLNPEMLKPLDFGGDATDLLKELRKCVATEKETKPEAESSNTES